MKNTLRNLTLALLLVLAVLLGGNIQAADEAHVMDMAGLLTGGQRQELESKARAIEKECQFGVYIILVDDYRDYAAGDVFDAAMELYKDYDLGYGSGKDGLLLLLSMDDRDYCLITYGDRGNLTFNDNGRSALAEFFLDDFRDDHWYDGLRDYLDWSENYLIAADAGEPYAGSNVPMTAEARTKKTGSRIAVILLLPLLVAGIWIGMLRGKMKSVAKETLATAYIEGNLELTRQFDQYTHTTETRTKIQRSSSGGSGGGSSHRHSGGFSGTRGKF